MRSIRINPPLPPPPLFFFFECDWTFEANHTFNGADSTLRALLVRVYVIFVGVQHSCTFGDEPPLNFSKKVEQDLKSLFTMANFLFSSGKSRRLK